MAEQISSALKLLGLYEQMLLIRCAENRLSRLFGEGKIPGFIHLGIVRKRPLSVSLLPFVQRTRLLPLTEGTVMRSLRNVASALF